MLPYAPQLHPRGTTAARGAVTSQRESRPESIRSWHYAKNKTSWNSHGLRRHVQKLGREFHPIRENLHLSNEQKANTIRKVAVDASTRLGRKVVSVDRTDGAKFLFEDGSWILVRLSGTEPIVRLYVEAESAAATKKLRREASDWILKDG